MQLYCPKKARSCVCGLLTAFFTLMKRQKSQFENVWRNIVSTWTILLFAIVTSRRMVLQNLLHNLVWPVKMLIIRQRIEMKTFWKLNTYSCPQQNLELEIITDTNHWLQYCIVYIRNTEHHYTGMIAWIVYSLMKTFFMHFKNTLVCTSSILFVIKWTSFKSHQ